MNALQRWLALRWLKSQVDAARKGGSHVLKLIDGNKRTIVTLGFVLSGFVALLTGSDVSQWIELMLRAFGWSDAGVIAGAKELATQIVPMLFAIWAAAGGLWKMWKQHKAGATAKEINSPAGVLKAAVADGSLVVVPSPVVGKPAVLELDSKPVVATLNGVTVIP